MSKHYGHETPLVNVDVFAFHTPVLSVSQKKDWLKHNGREWVYSIDDMPIDGVVNAWFDTEAEADA